jgi:hypothetical protein
MKFKIGDRVEVISAEDTGTVINIYKNDDNEIIVAVEMDHPEKFEPVLPKEYQHIKTAKRCVCHTTEDDVRLLIGRGSKEWSTLWDSNE